MNYQSFSDKVGKIEQDITDGKKSAQLTVEKIEKIKNNINTYVVSYGTPKFKAAFDYVDNLFPASKVKETVAYFADAKYLSYLGYQGVGGFCDTLSKTIIVATKFFTTDETNRIVGKASKDEVLVHEMLHYCNLTERNVFSRENLSEGDVNLHEEFAYGWSLGYLRDKGYADKEIIANNFLPYLAGRCASDAFLWALAKENISFEQYQLMKEWKKTDFMRKHHDKILNKQIELGLKIGEELVYIYSKKLKDRKTGFVSNQENTNRYELMDLD